MRVSELRADYGTPSTWRDSHGGGGGGGGGAAAACAPAAAEHRSASASLEEPDAPTTRLRFTAGLTRAQLSSAAARTVPDDAVREREINASISDGELSLAMAAPTREMLTQHAREVQRISMVGGTKWLYPVVMYSWVRSAAAVPRMPDKP